PVPNSPRRPIRRITEGRKASSALKATCWARPMQSSAMNCFAVRRATSGHSRSERWYGPAGAWRVLVSVAVDKGERAEFRFRPALPSAPHHQAHGCPDPPCCDETNPEGRRDRRGQLALQVRHSVDPVPQVVDRDREAVALGLDVALNL